MNQMLLNDDITNYIKFITSLDILKKYGEIDEKSLKINAKIKFNLEKYDFINMSISKIIDLHPSQTSNQINVHIANKILGSHIDDYIIVQIYSINELSYYAYDEHWCKFNVNVYCEVIKMRV